MSTKPKEKAENRVHKPVKQQSVGTQTEILSMNYIPPKVLSGFQLESEAYMSFFYKPHMVALLVTLCAIIAYTVYAYSQSYTDTSFIKNARMYNFQLALIKSNSGLVTSFGVIIYYGALYFPSSLMQRPHYSLWRIVLAISICYCATIIFILLQVNFL